MAYTLNTGHALYGNLIELIGVQSGALVSHKTARTFTKHASATYGSGTWGEQFNAVGGSYEDRGASISPAITINTATTTSYTTITILNSNGNGSGNAGYSFGKSDSPRLLGPAMRNNHIYGRGIEGTTAVGAANRMLTYCRIGETSGKYYLDKTLEVSSTSLGYDYADTGSAANYLGMTWPEQSGVWGIVWLAVFDKELSLSEISDLYDSLGAGNAFGLVASADSTAPTLSSASVTSVGSTTGTGNVTTNEGNGTLYSIVSTSATAPSVAQIQAGNDHTGSAAVWSGNQAVSSTGAKTLSITGLTSSTSYYAHFQHKDAANNNSSVVTSAQFTTGLADTTNPTMTGSVTISAKTTTSYTASWSAGSDNVSVTGYEYRLNAGSWVDLGSVLTVNISARTPGATDTLEVRAYDAAGNRATALSQSITLFIGTITIPAVKDWGTGNLKTAQTGVQVDIHNISTGALVVRKTGQTTHATTGVCVVQDAAIADATTYEVITRFADGSKGMWDYTASLT